MFSGGIPIGRFFGIEVKLHWSWFFILFLITWLLATGYFPSIEEYEDWSAATCWVLGLVTSILFFASVLAHELAHSLVAKAGGLKVSAITLFFFGGVSQLSDEPKSPGNEFLMAMAGPGTTLVIAGACWGIFFATQHPVSPVTGIAFWLAAMNTLLAVFNLIPGFPLDGGRVLRSIIWWRSHNLLRSTRIASIIGRGFGYLFIFGGIALIFTDYWSNGLWLLFLGWLLENAAAGSYRQMALRDIFRGHKVSEVMTQDCEVVPSTTTVEQLVNDHILVSGRRCYSVVDYGRALGLVTANDVRAVERKLWPVKTVRDIMTPIDKMRQVRPDDDLSTVMYLLMEQGVNQVPVLQDNNIIGMVWRDSLLVFVHVRSELGMKL
ncbi:MAG: site-2 protease family protein [Dehalococcoidia bacterium]|nr:site-2 protease family protein [Dehalococcoidia bacterium]